MSVGRSIVLEDAIAGVRAGHAGRFGLVIGVDRIGQAEALQNAGANIVVSDLSKITYSANKRIYSCQTKTTGSKFFELH